MQLYYWERHTLSGHVSPLQGTSKKFPPQGTPGKAATPFLSTGSSAAEAAAQCGEGKGRKHFMKHLLPAMLSPAVWQTVLFARPSGAQLSGRFWELLTQRSQRVTGATFWVFTRCKRQLPQAKRVRLGPQGAGGTLWLFCSSFWRPRLAPPLHPASIPSP